MRHGSAWIRDGTETDLANTIGAVGWAKSMSAKLTNYPTPVTIVSKTCCLSTSSVFPSHRGWRKMSDIPLGVSTLTSFPEVCGNNWEPSVSWASDTRGTHEAVQLGIGQSITFSEYRILADHNNFSVLDTTSAPILSLYPLWYRLTQHLMNGTSFWHFTFLNPY